MRPNTMKPYLILLASLTLSASAFALDPHVEAVMGPSEDLCLHASERPRVGQGGGSTGLSAIGDTENHEFRETFSVAQLTEFFQSTTGVYLDWIRMERHWWPVRDE